MPRRKPLPVNPLGAPPPMSEIPPLFVGYQRNYRQDSVPLDSLNLPEGYEPVKTKRGAIEPRDRLSKLRMVNEQWWEVTWVDGVIIPIRGRWRGALGTKYYQPPEFADRKMCSALDKNSREWCTTPKDECVRHCKVWSSHSGRACPNSPLDHKKVCAFHGGAPRRGPNSVTKTMKKGLYVVPGWMESGLEAVRAAVLGETTNLEPEISVLRVFNHKLVESLANHSEVWVRLKDAWNSFANAKSEADANRARASVAHLVQTGLDTAVAIKEIRATAAEIGKLSAIKEKIEVDRRSTVTPDQLNAIVATILGLVAGRFGSYKRELVDFHNDMRGLLNITDLQPVLDQKAAHLT